MVSEDPSNFQFFLRQPRERDVSPPPRRRQALGPPPLRQEAWPAAHVGR